MPVEQPIGPAFKGGPNGTLIYDILSLDCRDGKCAACTGDAKAMHNYRTHEGIKHV